MLEGEIVTNADGAAVRTPVALFPVIDIGAAGRLIRVGIRPEWLRLSTRPLPEAESLEVTLVEPLGADILVHARWPNGELVARAPADFVAPEHGQVWIDAEACQVDLFDNDGRRVAASGPPSAGSARALAARLAQTHIGVIAWSRTGDPELGDWGPPVVLIRTGVIPDEFEAGGGVE
jgi:hypothetical protein